MVVHKNYHTFYETGIKKMGAIAEFFKKIGGKKEEPVAEQNKEEIQGEYFDLFPTMCSLADLLGEACVKKGLETVFDIAWSTPRRLCGNEEELKELLSELLVNAAEYTDKGKIVFGLSFEKQEEDSEQVMLDFSVMCSGKGIEEDKLASLRKLCETSGSSLNSETVADLGAKYSFVMKMGVAAWEPLGSFEKAYNEDLRKRMSIRENFTCPEAEILIVDDNIMNLEVIKSLLEHTKIRIDTAVSGDEGIAKAAEKKYDMIFLDHMMPDKDGIETLREMNGDNGIKSAVMVCLTANAISGAKKWYLSEGFDDYLAKPVTSEKLEDILLKHLPADKIIKGAEP